MLSVGVNAPSTRFGKPLRDGAACLVSDGTVVSAIAEERLTRTKADSGFANALPYVLMAAGASAADVDTVVVSTCCEAAPAPSHLDSLRRMGFNQVLSAPSHHFAHACSAFYPSPFDRAIILVLDGGGSVAGDADVPEWWTSPREQASYFLGVDSRISELGADFDAPYAAGFGEAYRAFTYFLGWHSGRYAAKTMALAGYGDPSAVTSGPLFWKESGQWVCALINNPHYPIEMVQEAARKYAWRLTEPRRPGTELRQEHMDLAAFLQAQLGNAVVAIVRELIRETGCRNVCLAGGVAFNCVMNQAILEESGADSVFVQPAAGDQGQSLGCAYHGQISQGWKREPAPSFPVFLGREYPLGERSILQLVPRAGFDIRHVADPSLEAARLLSADQIVGWYQGRGEFGPRALGHRSLLANPRGTSVRERLDRIKGREAFMPYAPSVTAEAAPDFFQLRGSSPHMLLAPKVRTDARSLIPAVIHTDGTARVQTVSLDVDPLFHGVLTRFAELSGVPVVLNTSLNREEEPIAESPSDAIGCLINSEVDALVIGNFVITRRGGVRAINENAGGQ